MTHTMRRHAGLRSLIFSLSFVLAIAVFTRPASAQMDPQVSLTVGTDVLSDYYFRGFPQEADASEGVVVWPYADLGVTLTDTVSLNFGSWNSLHSETGTGTFYEADYYASMSFTAGNWGPGVLYTAYTSPNDSFDTVHELAFSLGYDDSASEFALSPSVMAAFGLNEGYRTSYMQFGIGPSVPLGEAASLDLPVTYGFSLHDYYGDDSDGRFGFFSIGPTIGVPVGEYFEVHGGVDLIWFSENANPNDDFKAVPKIGASVTF